MLAMERNWCDFLLAARRIENANWDDLICDENHRQMINTNRKRRWKKESKLEMISVIQPSSSVDECWMQN
jgi:hypothetical protein